jgi:ferritin-like metal-binding protein YciE
MKNMSSAQRRRTPVAARRCTLAWANVRGDAMTRKQKTLDDLVHETLKDIYYAEKKILTALPKMAKAAQSEELQAAFEKHERETKGQVDRLEQIFAMLEQPAKGKTCDAINGMIDEAKEVMKELRCP